MPEATTMPDGVRRPGLYAVRHGRGLEVKNVGRGRYQEVVDTRLVGPVLDDLDRLEVVDVDAVVDGHEVWVRRLGDGSVGHGGSVWVGASNEGVATALGLTGSFREGWAGEVEVSRVRDIRESVRVIELGEAGER